VISAYLESSEMLSIADPARSNRFKKRGKFLLTIAGSQILRQAHLFKASEHGRSFDTRSRTFLNGSSVHDGKQLLPVSTRDDYLPRERKRALRL
jgi:hypothetical protein